MSAPFQGEEFTFPQPDGTSIRVRGWGDQDWAEFETLDGIPVTLDPASGYYRPDPHGALEAAALPDTASGPPEPGLPRPHWKTRRQQARGASAEFEGSSLAPPLRATVGDYVGLCLLVQFPDVPGTIPRADVEMFCNEPGYSGYGNRGSVYDYFLENSGGRLRYKTVVAPYYTAKHPRSHYTDVHEPYGKMARALIREALAYHRVHGFDFSRLTVDGSRYVFATNVLYAGRRTNAWKQGLWPHASRLDPVEQLAAGVYACDYQVTDMGDELALGTYCHENGHMLCDFPDLYSYRKPAGGVGTYCLMCSGGLTDRKNPTHVGAYLKYQAGWAGSVTQITSGVVQYTARAGANQFFVHARNAREYFILENRQRHGRDAQLPDSGLAIWHVDEAGNNSNTAMTPELHFECSLEQADGRFDLERGDQYGDSNDLFSAGPKDRFTAATSPNSQWWDGTPSGLEVTEISASGPTMTFRARR